MHGKWLIEGNHIALSVENEILHPSADELYEAIANRNTSFIKDIDCPDIKEAFPNIYFSKIGTDIRCQLEN